MTAIPKVSIVIPVYNGSNFLSQAIDSALAQTYSNIEIIVVNDGSNDDGETERIALSYKNQIRYFSKKNGGVASALNLAIAEMAGEYFSWLSHDDLYCPNKIETQIQAMHGMDRAKTILYCDLSVFSGNPNKVKEIHLRHVLPEQFRLFLITSFLHGCTLLIPREAFTVCGTFNEKLRTTQDYDLWFRLAEKYRFVHIPAVLVKSRQHEAQGSITMKDTVLAERNALLIGFVENLPLAELVAATHKAASTAYAEISINLCRRGLYPAGQHARALALKKLGEGSFVDALSTFFVLSLIPVTRIMFGLARWSRRRY